ncbi:hypothetical protein AZE42_08379 [Rhizopogon vesiculosus]|uniref:Uncharacterized protein n=1 Tax=Rhizopogon vesiculosus TaxID=180088 RepID=A0A1J8QDJ3_9AGAM|nr:hypothetical protein AZE42_08379 [Rhizopogon vesiculosus]
MTFGEVIHYVPHSKDWPEPVRGIASLLLPLYCTERPGDQECSASNPSAEPLNDDTVPASQSYTAMDFQHLIDSTAADLKAIAGLPLYGGARSTVPLWSQLLHALANTFSPDVLILEETTFVMPRAQDAASQPSDLIDGHATLIAAHIICSTPRIHDDRSRTNSGNGEDEDELMHSADYDSCDGSVDSLDGLDLPLQAHMLPGRGKWHYAVLPVLLVANSRNIVPLLCSTLYQRRVWGLREPVVGLCCSNTGTTATAIFGWLDPDQSDEGCMPVAHLALAASDSLDPLMGVFDISDSSSAISMAQFLLRLRSHFRDIEDIASIEAVNSLTPFYWRSDVPDFETQIGAQLEDRVASWTHQVHVQTGSSETSSSSAPRTPSPLSDFAVFLSSDEMSSRGLDIIHEEDVKPRAPLPTDTTGKARLTPQPPSSKDVSGSQRSYQSAFGAAVKTPSRYSNSVFAAASDAGLVKRPTISNWLFERNAWTVGRIAILHPDRLDSGINEMIKIYDEITGFTWSDAVETMRSVIELDTTVLGVRDRLFEEDHPSPDTESAIEMPKEDVEFISARLSALLHAVQGARDCEGIAALHGANEAERRHEWDALLLKFFQPVAGERDVLLERRLNFPRNAAVHDASFAQRAVSLTEDYEEFCVAQRRSLAPNQVDLRSQASAAQAQAIQYTEDIKSRAAEENFFEDIAEHSRREPDKGVSDAVLVIPCSRITTAILECIHGGKTAHDRFLKTFVLVHGKPDKQDVVSSPPTNTRPRPRSLVSESRKKTGETTILRDMYRFHPDRIQAANGPSQENALPEASGQDLLLPVLLSEYKKKDESTIAKAMNQMRTYLVSALHFLDALSITEQPIFGLVVNGRLGAVTMAWKKNEKIYVMERNVRHYDITDPLQAFQFVSVLLRLARYGLKLRARLEQKNTAYYESLAKSRWSKLAQIEEETKLNGPEQVQE